MRVEWINIILDGPKRRGIIAALSAVGLEADAVTDIVLQSGNEEEDIQAIDAVLNQPGCSPRRPTGWITCDEGFAAMLSFCARRRGLQIPKDLSVVTFHDTPYFRYLEPSFTTATVKFFESGQLAVEKLFQAYNSGENICGFEVEPDYRWGDSIARSDQKMKLTPLREAIF